MSGITAVNDSPITENITPISTTAIGASTASHECVTPKAEAIRKKTTP